MNERIFNQEVTDYESDKKAVLAVKDDSNSN